MACDCCNREPRRGQPLFVRIPPAGAVARLRLPAGRYFQFWNAASGQVKMTVEYGAETCALPTVAGFVTSPIYLNPFDSDGFLAFVDATAGVGSRGWLIISGD